ncbi:MAG TPA: hypothetical protein VGT03_14065 [Candidatus Acidoferrales bacterium]|nr:hypothetical protein [Candidatus Acidoferrales bacterium]
MTASLLLLWALTGGAVASWVMILIWKPDPPPNIAGKFIGILVAGAIGGLIGGPMLGMTGAVAVASIVSAGTFILGRVGARTGH